MLRSLILAFTLLTTPAFAQQDVTYIPADTAATTASAAGTSTATAPEKDEFGELRNTTEFGLMVSSIAGGTQYANLGLIRHVGENWELGIRGSLPMEFGEEASVYMGQLFGRYAFINSDNVMFLEAQAIQGFYSSKNTTTPFGGLGLTYGYRRNFTSEFNAGVNMGVDWATARITRNEYVSNTDALYNRVSFVGGYNF